MQTKIFESLDRLHEIVQKPGGVKYNDKYYADEASRTEHHLAVISQKLDKVIASISSLESRISRLSVGSSDYAIKDLRDNIMGRIEAMDNRIAGHFYQTQRSFQEANKSREKESTTSIWLYITLFTVFAVAIGSFVLYQTKKEMNQKKFI
ncbi:hypothetical protein C1645_127519 [Glomus cerebriforme]|uniref:Uncharacterized protein n=1 Tax=Glomus cerebriforme TaxID=658196 RepID=A0A397SYQ6_9GLOM|nr:hypothetical protein C1645_127519 [Glomus cerebriforme]